MKKIFKYKLALTAHQILQMPADAEVLSFQLQDKDLCAWALVDPEAYQVPRGFVIVGTGHEVPKRLLKFIGTAQQGPFVWHLFEVLL